MRWANLQVPADEERRLPGYRDAAVVRRFDAPEALDVRFYEVRARSALNRVPERSRMPFRWTINPYRGCTHACVYCLAGDTPILMADGRTRPLADVRTGDKLYGTVRNGRYRRYAITEVLAHWSTVKPAYRVSLDDGTELTASADHRFLTRRGWKHVTRTEQGLGRRAHLTVGSELMGPGRSAGPPEESEEYRHGYLCGLIRGDGHVGSYSYDRVGRTHGDDLCSFGVETQEFAYQAAAGHRRAMTALRTSARSGMDAVRELIRWPISPSDPWQQGFLAGIFDAEGSCGRDSALRIANTDPVLLDWVASCLGNFGFDTALDDSGRENGLRYVRLRGGVSEQLRFFSSTDPAIVRKRMLEGRALKNRAVRKVVSIEPLRGAMRLFDITTGTGDFIADGVVSHNCFARPTHTYLDFDTGRDFEREIVVKVNAPEVLRAELARPSWRREHVALGTNTDPYQWVEGRYRLMPGIWEALRDAANPCSVLTKSPLVLRDLPLLREIADRTPVAANLSVPTLDERAWRATEPHTPHPRARLEAVAELNRSGIPTGVLIAPLMPGINDAPEQVEPILELAAEAGAVGVSGIALHLRGEVRGIFFEWLDAHRPDLVDRYRELYPRGAYATAEERRRLSDLVGGGRRAPARGRRLVGDCLPRRDPAPPPGDAGRRRPARAVDEAPGPPPGGPGSGPRSHPGQGALF